MPSLLAENDKKFMWQIPRVVVVGSTESGKTTLARQISRLLDVPHVELDALNWEANCIPTPTDVFR